MEFSKCCTGPCGEEKPLEAFRKHKGSKDGRSWSCKKCLNAADAKRLEDPVRRAKRNAAYRKRRRDDSVYRAKLQKRDAAKYRRNRQDPVKVEQMRAAGTKYNRKIRADPKRRAEINKRAAERDRERRETEPEYRARANANSERSRQKRFRTDPDYPALRRAQRKKACARAHKKRMADPVRRAEHNAKYRAYIRKRKKEDPAFRLACRIRSRLSKIFTRTKKSAASMKLVGCTWPELKAHIEAQFLPGMTWENIGEWEIDHIIPFAAFDITVEENQYIVCWYKNLQPLWMDDNRSKSAKYEEEDQLDLIRRYSQRSSDRACNRDDSLRDP